MKSSQIELKNISFGYTEDLVLQDINMSIKQGDYVGIVGPNGAAKSTLLKLMVGTLKPKSGTVELFGTPIQRFKGWQDIGYVSQRVRDFNLSFPATVEELISASMMDKKSFNPFSKKNKEKIREILSIVGMEEFQNAKIGELSGGQQQRIFIARALANNPKVLLLDEPTVGVDVASQQQFYNLLEKLNQELKLTLVMVSHDLGVVAKKANVIACIANKQLVLHDNHSFQHSDYIQLTYGEGVELLTHGH